MKKLYKYLKIKLTKKKYFIILTKNFVYKVPFTFSSYLSLCNEIDSYRLAKKSNFWENSFLNTSFYGFISCSPRGDDKMDRHKLDVVELLDNLLLKMKSKPRRSALELIDIGLLSDLVDVSKVKYFKNSLSKIFLPKSVAHGDLHIGNMLYFDKKIIIIDWETYRENSSFLFDYVHYYVREECLVKNESWTNIVFDHTFINSLTNDIVNKINICIPNLIFAYSINRMILEINQFGNVGKLKPKKVKKYLNLIDNLLI